MASLTKIRNHAYSDGKIKELILKNVINLHSKLVYVIVKAWDLWTRDRAVELIDLVLFQNASKDTLFFLENLQK